MSKILRLSGGIIRVDGNKMYYPEYRDYLAPGRFVARYPKRGEDHDKMDQYDKEAKKVT